MATKPTLTWHGSSCQILNSQIDSSSGFILLCAADIRGGQIVRRHVVLDFWVSAVQQNAESHHVFRFGIIVPHSISQISAGALPDLCQWGDNDDDNDEYENDEEEEEEEQEHEDVDEEEDDEEG